MGPDYPIFTPVLPPSSHLTKNPLCYFMVLMKPPFTEATPEAGGKAGEEIYRHYASMMDRKGLTDDYLAKKLKAELNAKLTKVFLPKNSRKLVYSDPLINWDTRQKARMDAHKLKGHYPAEKHQVGFDQEQIQAAFQWAIQAVVGVISSAISDPATKQRIAEALRSKADDFPGDSGPALPSTPG